MPTAEEQLRNGYAALSRGDLDVWLKGFAEDAELHELAEAPDTQVYRGRDEIRTWATRNQELVEDWDWVPEEFIALDNGRVLVRVRFRARGRGSGILVEQAVFHLVDFDGEAVAAVRGFIDEATARRAAENPDA